MAGLKEENLLFVRYERGSQHTECLPYYIALDHETKSVGELVARQTCRPCFEHSACLTTSPWTTRPSLWVGSLFM